MSRRVARRTRRRAAPAAAAALAAAAAAVAATAAAHGAAGGAPGEGSAGGPAAVALGLDDATLAWGFPDAGLELNATSLRMDEDGTMAAAAAVASAIPEVMEIPVMLASGRTFTTATDVMGPPSRVASTFDFPALLDLSFRSLAFIYVPITPGFGGLSSLYRFSLVDGESFDVRVGERGGTAATPSASFSMARAVGNAPPVAGAFERGFRFLLTTAPAPQGGDVTRLTVTGVAGPEVEEPDVTFLRGLVETIKENHERFYTPARCSTMFRTSSGTCNNLERVETGSRMMALGRLPVNDPAFDDGVSSPSGGNRPSARLISNIIGSQTGDRPNARGLADTIWTFGQYLDHDLGLSPAVPEGPRAEDLPIPVAGDPVFSARGELPFHRTGYMRTGTACCGNLLSDTRPRAFANVVTAWIDASQLYGGDPVRASQLRTFSAGRLKTSEGDNLPFNGRGVGGVGANLATDSEGAPPGARLFVAGDVRVNENVMLTSMHTIFLREHNRWATAIGAAFPDFNDERVYQTARMVLGAAHQKITYEEWLPALLGGDVSSFTGGTAYDPSIDPVVTAFFSTAALRIGHTMVSDSLARRGPGGAPLAPLRLASSFFNVNTFLSQGIDTLLRGAVAQTAQETDVFVVDGLRNLLFGSPGSGSGMDLVALNVQRGRDHGLPPYNDARAGYGLPRYSSFMQITSDAPTAQRLAMAYNGDINSVDAFIGGIAETHVPGGSVGPLFAAALRDQFRRLAAGDRMFYGRGGPAADGTLTARLPELANLRPGGSYGLVTVIERNTGITRAELPPRPFFASSSGGGAVPAPMMASEFDAMRQLAATTLMADAPGVAQDVGISVGVAV